jgi:hypothetical protein
LYPYEDYLPGIYIEESFFLALHIVIRSFIIAVRYGFCSELRYLMLSSASQTDDFIGKDLFFRGWLEFHPTGGGLSVEINSVLWRNQIDETLFELTFIEELDPIVH